MGFGAGGGELCPFGDGAAHYANFLAAHANDTAGASAPDLGGFCAHVVFRDPGPVVSCGSSFLGNPLSRRGSAGALWLNLA